MLIVPSLGLESFGLVAHEALDAGVPVLASNRGALAELFEPAPAPICGALFDPEHPEELKSWIARLVEHPEIVAEWSATAANRPRIKDMDEHAEEIEEIYSWAIGTEGNVVEYRFLQ